MEKMKLLRLISIALCMNGFSVSLAHAFPFSYMKMESSISASSVTTGDSISIDIVVENEEKDPSYFPAEVATNSIVTIDFPTGTTNFASQNCTQADSDTLEGVLPELSMGSVVNLSATATINSEGHGELIVTLDADALFGGPQIDEKRITVVAQQPDLSPVDLEHKLTF